MSENVDRGLSIAEYIEGLSPTRTTFKSCNMFGYAKEQGYERDIIWRR